ncbi:MAG: LPXTG cell wall anchor domain-containing protein [Lactobacillales bacterium]|jgi:LPXTG-motif cell wall-anchored protein|nr:LPXTG cell wall anchor domain-containing protein [Lactobacillales bacterium]
MRKIRNILFLGLMGLVLFIGNTVYAEAGDVNLRLHKILLDENDTTVIDNAGVPVTPKTGTPLDGAEFTVYDVTALIESGETRDSLIELFTNKGIAPFENEEVSRGVTGEKGIKGEADFIISSLSNGKNASYLIIETGKPAIAKEVAQPMLISFPLNNEDGTAMTTIDLYPKNYEYARNPYFYKHGRDYYSKKDLGALEGAKFRLYKVDETGKRWYLHEDVADNANNHWVKEANSEEVTIFTSDKSGKVSTNSRFLSAGTYYFEEISTVENYEITKEALQIKVTIPENTTEPVMITVEDKTTSMDEAIVYNDFHETPKEEKPNKPVTPSNEEHLLPETGEAIRNGATVLGIAILLQLAFLYFHKRKRFNEEKK